MSRMSQHDKQADIFQRDVYSVSRLNREVRGVLESDFPLLWVEGELSNLARPSSGHLYFSLKDANAQVRCAMFRQWNLRLGFRPTDGQRVLLKGRVSLYETRGEFQLIVEYMEEAGEGALRRAFEALKRKLQAEGLFRDELKRDVPFLPRRIGVITSPSGAAVRDVLHVLQRRFPAVPVHIYPVSVQGSSAPGDIVAAFSLAAQRKDCDVLIVARGGGSLEDLMAFNDESVARAIHACPIPVVSGVGHEVDFTITDFVADLRAPTPSAAAELVVPDKREWIQRLNELLTRCTRATAAVLEDGNEEIRLLATRLRRLHPERWLKQQVQRLDEFEYRLNQASRNGFERRVSAIATLAARLNGQTPIHRLHHLIRRCESAAERLRNRIGHTISQRAQRLRLAERTLGSMNPQSTLDRGYAIVTDVRSGSVLSNAGDVAQNDEIRARLSRGEIRARVLSTQK